MSPGSRRSAWTALIVVLALSIGCGGSPSVPSRLPSSTAGNPSLSSSPVSPAVVLTGQVRALNGGRELDDVTLSVAGLSTRTDGAGRFRLEWPAGVVPGVVDVTLTGRQIVSRSARLSLSTSREVALDAISTADGFSLDYYRQLVRDGFENPGALRAVRRWTRAPMIYLKTVDERGEPIDIVTLEHVADALQNEAPAYTGQRFGLAGIQRGTGSQEGVSGWVTVRWANPAVSTCGRAQVAQDGGFIELNYLDPRCGCGSSRMGSATVKHELGHMFGFFHTDGDAGDLMFNTLRGCSGTLSARERAHAAVAYGRPNGNLDPDADPSSSILLRPQAAIVLP